MNLSLSKILLATLIILPLASQAFELKGQGSKMSAQIFEGWGKQYSSQNADTTIQFKTGNGIDNVKLVEQGSIDFGDTDIPLSKQELESKGLAQFPYMFTAISPVINLPNVFDGQLRLDGKTLSDIYLGKITKWNDAAITALNPRLPLPDEKILVVHGAEGTSGSFALHNYLSKISPEWRAAAGTGASPNWPTGTAIADLFAMGDYVKKTPYSIGYAEISHARKHEIIYVQMQNSQGKFVSPHVGSVEKAVQNVSWKSSNGFFEEITDERGMDSWPITAASYIVIRKTSDNIPHRLALLKFLGWGLYLGDMIVTNLDLMPIKRTLLPQIRSIWNDTPLTLEGAQVVNAKQVLDLRTNGITIVDSRVATEFVESHIPKAVNIPYVEKSEKSANFNPEVDSFDLSKLPPNKNSGVVFYCNAGACWKGYKAAVLAVKAGYKNVYWFRGGLPEWRGKSYPVEASNTTTVRN